MNLLKINHPMKWLNRFINSRISNKEDSEFQLNLINISLKELNKVVYISNESKYILSVYIFEEVVKYDKRWIISLYYIFLISKQVIKHAFFI